MASDKDVIAELSRLMSLTQNGQVRKMLFDCMAQVSPAPIRKQESASAVPKADAKAEAQPAARSGTPVNTSGAKELVYETITTFSWENTDDVVKVLIPLEGVTKELVTVDFTKSSFDLRVKGLNGKNYRCLVSNLSHPVNPESCSFMIPRSHKRVVVKLTKASTSTYAEKNWSDLKEKPKALSEKKGSPDMSDPDAGLMNLMKNLYDEGDEDMKRTIAKSWTEAREGKKPEPPSMDDLMPDLPSMPPMPDLKF
eukprot:CAMPEP_0118933532 /NCGR_PEP_ID=MMETSP1169-20130426/12041_1 /TAXON_ID=36882 /ORGANISM="Pyramimonas obovata, Strain CCMP722" /LENGTH=252 /DNA_ID=CAMNT_0006876303 /DNA_START=66 /DNA_END=824 /DNA_ORIENTATION=-